MTAPFSIVDPDNRSPGNSALPRGGGGLASSSTFDFLVRPLRFLRLRKRRPPPTINTTRTIAIAIPAIAPVESECDFEGFGVPAGGKSVVVGAVVSLVEIATIFEPESGAAIACEIEKFLVS